MISEARGATHDLGAIAVKFDATDRNHAGRDQQIFGSLAGMDGLVDRLARPRLADIASWLRIAIVNGPRQSGKTTLLREFQRARGGTFVSLDDDQALEQLHRDPITFVRFGERPLIIDEVQRGGDPLVRAIKLAVDESRDRGQFILSGSAKFLTVPTISESLAGRARFLDLWTLSMAELHGGSAGFGESAFNDPAALPAGDSPWTRDDYIDAMVAGGYPELLPLPPESNARHTWFTGYLTTVIERDISQFAEVQHAPALKRLLALIAARSGGSVVQADLARSLELNRETIRNYLAYLEMVFLLTYLPAWSTNLTSKVAKAPKAYVTDSGLAAHLLNVDANGLRVPGHRALGGLVETFALAELMKIRATSDVRFDILHYRENDSREIDFILEGPNGRIVALEIKASVSPPRGSDQHLRWLRQKVGDRFAAGFLLHLGTRSGSLGDGIFSIPLSALWGHARHRH